MPVARWMALCNAHYYASRDPFGTAGDFTTAPEISQMFGELVGLALADCWVRAGSPPGVQLIELGPGRGTLMADALRATARVPGFVPQVHFVETSPVLRAAQAERVPGAQWHSDVSKVPGDRPILLITNEFFDALPVRQFVRTPAGWRERLVAVVGEGFAPVVLEHPTSPSFPRRREPKVTEYPRDGRSPGPEMATLGSRLRRNDGGGEADGARSLNDERGIVPAHLWGAPVGTVWETSPISTAIASDIGARLEAQGGAALIVDYGDAGGGATLQAVRAHGFADPFTDPGEVDLTAHVDFCALMSAAGVAAHGPVGQGTWLRAVGIEARAAALKARATAPQAAAIDAALLRLTGEEAMGVLFKVMGLSGGGWPAPAGFAA